MLSLSAFNIFLHFVCNITQFEELEIIVDDVEDIEESVIISYIMDTLNDKQLNEVTKNLIPIGMQYICRGDTHQFINQYVTPYISSIKIEPPYPIKIQSGELKELDLQSNTSHIKIVKSRLYTELHQYKHRKNFIVDSFCEYIQRKQVTCVLYKCFSTYFSHINSYIR